MFIDTHAHLVWGQLKGKESEVVARASQAKVNQIITVGCNLSSIASSKICAHNFDQVYFSAGIHPDEIKNDNLDWDYFTNFLTDPKCKAIGECGFDFFRGQQNEAIQISYFEKQIALAKTYKMPLIIHSRGASELTLQILKKNQVKNFVIHCFTESLEFAEEVLKLGGLISFTGIITYPKAESIRQVIKAIPLEKIILETDCPYLAPQSVRGEINEPKYIPEIAQKIADIKQISLQEVADKTTHTAKNFFKI